MRTASRTCCTLCTSLHPGSACTVHLCPVTLLFTTFLQAQQQSHAQHQLLLPPSMLCCSAPALPRLQSPALFCRAVSVLYPRRRPGAGDTHHNAAAGSAPSGAGRRADAGHRRFEPCAAMPCLTSLLRCVHSSLLVRASYAVFSLPCPSAVIPCRTRQIPIRTLKLSYIGPR